MSPSRMLRLGLFAGWALFTGDTEPLEEEIEEEEDDEPEED